MTPVRKDASGLIECMSTDGGNCWWGSSSQCTTWTNTAGSYALRPGKCTRAAMATAPGWCYYGAVHLGLATGKANLQLQLLGLVA